MNRTEPDQSETGRGRLGRALIRAADDLVDILILLVIVLLVFTGIWAVSDNDRITNEASAAVYETYKPEADEDSLSFAGLQALNPDVLGWITVYGTGIDYPLVQGEDNNEYINKDAKGDFSIAGSLFLDSDNADDFSDFSTIIYGHHLEKSRMFGDLDRFADKSFFDSHAFGSLYYDGSLRGLSIFAVADVDAYDSILYNPHAGSAAGGQSPAAEMQDRQNYLAYISGIAIYTRNIGVKESAHIVMLSTCGTGTNERYVLFARIDSSAKKNPFAGEEKKPVKTAVSGRSGEAVLQKRLVRCLMMTETAVFVLYLFVRIWDIRAGKRRQR